MHANGGDDGIGFGIDDSDVIGTGIDHVDFVLLTVGGDAGGFASDVKGLRQPEHAHVDDADSIALAVRHVGVLTKERAVVRKAALVEVPPSRSTEDGQQNSDEQELAQGAKIPWRGKISRTENVWCSILVFLYGSNC